MEAHHPSNDRIASHRPRRESDRLYSKFESLENQWDEISFGAPNKAVVEDFSSSGTDCTTIDATSGKEKAAVEAAR